MVLAVAAFAEVTAATALAFVVGRGAAVLAGVDAVVMSICEWTGAC